MPYADVVALRAHIGLSLRQLLPAEPAAQEELLAGHLLAAEAEMDSAFQGAGYAVPVVAGASALSHLLRATACNLAAWHFGTALAKGLPEGIKAAAEASREWLAAVRSRKALLPGIDVPGEEVAARVSAVATFVETGEPDVLSRDEFALSRMLGGLGWP